MPELTIARKKKTGWTTVAFGDVVQLSKERTSDPEADGYERYVGLEHIDPGELHIRRWGDIADGVTFTNVFRPGQVLFGKRRAYQRKVAVAHFSGVCSGDIYVLEPKGDALLPELLPFICQTDAFFEHAVGTSAGSLSPRTNWKSLADFEFALPPIEEQRRMAAVLDAAERTIDSLRALKVQLHGVRIAHLNDFFKPRYAKGLPLPKVVSIASGGTPSKSRSEYWGGQRPWASGKDLKTRSLTATELQLTDKGWAVAKIAPAGSTLIVVRGMILAHTFPVAQCAVSMAFNQDLRALIAHDGVLPDYLTLWAEWAGPWFLTRTSESSHGTKRIDSEIFDDALIPVPSHDVQHSFVQEQTRLLEQEAQLVQRENQARNCKAALLRSVLGAVA